MIVEISLNIRNLYLIKRKNYPYFKDIFFIYRKNRLKRHSKNLFFNVFTFKNCVNKG